VSARSLAEWLEFIGCQHPDAIALGLDRVREVHRRLDLRLTCPVITVAGTNGKGSTCAVLEAILSASGRRVGLYTSPHLVRYHERVRIGGREALDAELTEGFRAVEAARRGEPLTYFEYGTLAALWAFAQTAPDVLVLEVGLGGRLDAVNVVDADCAVITSVDVDHIEYLGGTRESIGREKAGIFRRGRPAVVADPSPPDSVLAAAAECGAALLMIGRDFDFRTHPGQWDFRGPRGARPSLAYPAMRGARQVRNAAAALAALDALYPRIAVTMQDVRLGLAQAVVPGRFQVLPGRPQTILDVAHNPEAARTLADNLGASGFAAQTLAVLGMLRDKDMAGVVRAVAPRITGWHLGSLGGARGASSAQLAQALARAGVEAPATQHASVAEAFAAARGRAGENDKIVVFGSFLTVAEVMQCLAAPAGAAAHG